VNKSGMVAFLEWLTLTAKLPFIVDRKIQVSSLLMTNTYWKEILFNKASMLITRTNVDSLFLSLAASGILEIQNSRRSHTLHSFICYHRNLFHIHLFQLVPAIQH